MKFGAAFTLFSSFVSTALAVSFIVPGAVWSDTSGAKIQAHGGHVIKVGSTFYWLGYSTTAGVRPNIYTSTDLMNWTHFGIASTAVSAMYRPKFVSSGGKWYIWGQVNREIVTLVAPGSSPLSTAYTLTGSPQLLPPDARSFSDMGVFVADNGAYRYPHTREPYPNYYRQDQATSSPVPTLTTFKSTTSMLGTQSRLAVESQILASGSLEGPGMFKSSGGVYYLIMSQKTGYRSNPNKVYWAPSLAGPWSGGTDIAPESANTYNSQNSAELVIKGTSTTSYIFLGDAWDSTGSDASNYEWLPITVSDSAHTLTLQNLSMWTVNPNTGVVSSSGFSNITIKAADGIVSGSAVVKKRAVHNINSSSNVTFNNIIGKGDKQWVSFEYAVNNVTAGEAHVVVNGGAPVNLSQLNSRAGHYSTVPVALELQKGVNTLTFGATGHDFEAHLEGIQVFDDY
ncbi:Arabinanase/levansucrase/invertase [Mycena belliarum]|uniref:Arabinanase/levansucrase/invertase n=1 Tax=Mycena belliarum TaxID=1033014 RepID=A0AAD6UDC8_9AGAR|nr:Arabinanase/levansucrase/invertase [Mycena belliae]